MRWRLILEEFGPELNYIKGEHNVVADALSRLELTEEDFSPDCFAYDSQMSSYPLQYSAIMQAQQGDNKLQRELNKGTYKKMTFEHSDHSYELIVNQDDKIVLPENLQGPAVKWYHEYMMHTGETRTELTMAQHYYFRGMRSHIQESCRKCGICQRHKPKKLKRGLIPAKKSAEIIPWYTLCIDLIGPYSFGSEYIGSGEKRRKNPNFIQLHCLTMIDPATGWFEIVEIPNKQADYVSNILEFQWFSRYPWPTEVVMDRGTEFQKEVIKMLKDDYPCIRKVITTRNPQANSMIERVHQVVHQMIASQGIRDKRDVDEDFGFQGVLSAVRSAMRAVVHTTTRATPSQLVFGRDALLNVSFEADWQYIKERKQKLIIQNNKRENKTRKPYVYSVGDTVMVRLDPSRKHGTPKYEGPYTIERVYDNGTVRLTKDAPDGGAVRQTWNIRNTEPCAA